jgi:glycosyltransferase involved in cell wall biosynthesis
MVPRKICIVTHLFPIDRSDYKGAFVCELATELQKRGHRVHVVTPMRPGAARREAISGVIAHRYRYWGWRRGRQLGQLRGTPVLLLGSLVLLGVIKTLLTVFKNDIDLLHAYWVVPGGMVALVAGLLSGRPVVATAAGSDLNIAPGNRLVRPLVKLTLRNVSELIAVSTSLKQMAVDLGLPEKKGVVVHGPVGIYSRNSHRTQERPLTGTEYAKKVLYVGNLTPPKRVDTIVRAMRWVTQRLPGVQLTILGDGHLRSAHEALAESLAVRENTRFLGAVPHERVLSLMNDSDLFVHCSDREGLPVAVVEAMASGLPVVASRVGGIPDVVHNGETGFLLSPGDVEGYAEKIVLILTNEGLRRQMGTASRLYAEKRLHKDVIIAELENVYESVLGRRT